MKKSVLKQIIREVIAESKLNEGADWILLQSINKMIDEYQLFFMPINDISGDEIDYDTKEWKALYKKLSSKDKKIVDSVVKEAERTA